MVESCITRLFVSLFPDSQSLRYPAVCLPQQVARDYHPMNFRGTFADSADARLTVPSLKRKFLADTIAAVYLHRPVNHTAQYFARIELGYRGFHARILLAVGLPRTFPGKPARGTQFDLGIGDHPLNGLAARQQFTEGLS